MIRLFTPAVIVTIVVVLDQIAKAWIEAVIPLHGMVPVIDGLFNLTHIRNPGAAFGFLGAGGNGWRLGFFLLVAVVAIVVLSVFIYRTPPTDHLTRQAASLVLGGAIGNFIDRVWLGAVVDFLDFYVGRFHWPVFNIADSCITVGVTLLIFTIWRKAPQTPELSPLHRGS